MIIEMSCNRLNTEDVVDILDSLDDLYEWLVEDYRTTINNIDKYSEENYDEKIDKKVNTLYDKIILVDVLKNMVNIVAKNKFYVTADKILMVINDEGE